MSCCQVCIFAFTAFLLVAERTAGEFCPGPRTETRTHTHTDTHAGEAHCGPILIGSATVIGVNGISIKNTKMNYTEDDVKVSVVF